MGWHSCLFCPIIVGTMFTSTKPMQQMQESVTKMSQNCRLPKPVKDSGHRGARTRRLIQVTRTLNLQLERQ